MFSRFGTVLACDRQTDRQDDSKYRASIASCGKNYEQLQRESQQLHQYYISGDDGNFI